MFLLKGRSKAEALPLLLADADDVTRYSTDVPEVAWSLARRFWPGPLTLVFRKSAAISEMISGGRDTVALRVPDHPVPRAIARQLGEPVTGTSANRSGGQEATTAEDVRQEFGNRVDMVLDDVQPPRGQASTVLDISTGRPRILRCGAVSRREIEETCGEPVVA